MKEITDAKEQNKVRANQWVDRKRGRKKRLHEWIGGKKEIRNNERNN